MPNYDLDDELQQMYDTLEMLANEREADLKNACDQREYNLLKAEVDMMDAMIQVMDRHVNAVRLDTIHEQ